MILYSIQRWKRRNEWPGDGWKYAEGRWNRIGQSIFYTSASISLAKLETLANNRTGLGRRVVFEIEVLEGIPIREIELDDLPANWYEVPYPPELHQLTEDFLKSRNEVIMRVPSAQSFSEYNYLLNSIYPDFHHFIRRKSISDERFDKRLL